MIVVGLLCYVGVISIHRLTGFTGNLWRSGHRFLTEERQLSVRRPGSTQPSRHWLPDNNQSQIQPRHLPQAQTAEVFATPVRNFSRQAQWIESVKMFRDEDGFFITPPNLLMWDGDRGNMEWACPFDEFAQSHPDQANRIAQEYGNSGDYEYWNVEGIVRKYGPQADPYDRGGRGRRW